jgi:hypothetical protein
MFLPCVCCFADAFKCLHASVWGPLLTCGCLFFVLDTLNSGKLQWVIRIIHMFIPLAN